MTPRMTLRPVSAAISLTLEDKDADKLLRVRTPYNRTENITLDGVAFILPCGPWST